ncbi:MULTISPECIES: transposase, partial [unclassified Peribacillus]|uniref:transposase n=1 Tax=unclassified Peribacillus TaxID=2675266 RepID=UPI0036714EEC
AYSFHTAADRNGFVLGSIVTPGNTHAKEKHGMRWTTLRGLKKLSMQAMLTFNAMNIKKMANWTWQGPKMA